MSKLKAGRSVGILNLVHQLIAEPEAIATLRKLDATSLNKIVDNIGLEDAGPLLSLLSTPQLEGIFDLDIWQNFRPGQEEKFESRRFGTWLEVLLEMGAERAAEKIIEFDPDLLTFAFSELVYVLSLESMAMQFSQAIGTRLQNHDIEKILESSLSYEFEGFLLLAKEPVGWDSLLSLFVELDSAHYEYFVKMLDRLEYISSDQIEENGLNEVLSASEQIASDVSLNREQRLEGRGYVPPVSAKNFLKLIGTSSLEDILSDSEDPIARSYFNNLNPKEENEWKAPDTTSQRWAQRLFSAIENLDLKVSPESNEDSKVSKISWLQKNMRELSALNPTLFERQRAELAFLANVLVTGYSKKDGERFRPAEATELAIEIVEEGFAAMEKRLNTSKNELLEKQSLIKAFRFSWKRRSSTT